MYPFFVQIAHQHHGNRPGVYPAGVVAHHIGFFQVAHLLQDMGHQYIETQEFGNHPHQVGIKGVGLIDLVHHFLAFRSGHQQSGFFQLVQLQAHGIGAVAKLLGQAAQMSLDLGVGEKFKQEFEPGLAGNQGRKNGGGGGLKRKNGNGFARSPTAPKTAVSNFFAQRR